MWEILALALIYHKFINLFIYHKKKNEDTPLSEGNMIFFPVEITSLVF